MTKDYTESYQVKPSTIYIGLALIAVIVIAPWRGRSPSFHLPAGVVAPAEPLQEPVNAEVGWGLSGFKVYPLARYQITARVIAAARYRFDRESALAPVDLVLGWGPMSDSSNLNQITFWQTNRFYYWSTKTVPLPFAEITSHSANVHLIPATPDVRTAILNINPEEVITLRGFLVQVTGSDGWQWRSSLLRNDSGAGACELIWVESLS